MRSSISIAFLLGLCLAFGHTQQADAHSSFNLILLSQPSGECSGDTGGPGGTAFQNGACDAEIGDTLKFAINLLVGEDGTNAWSIDLAWDKDLQDALSLVNVESVTTFYKGFENPTPPPATIGYNALAIESEQDSSPTEEGRINQISGATAQDLTLTISNTSFRAATITFDVDSKTGTDISLGFFRTDGASMGSSASQFITPDFGSFAINAPEPNGALLGIASLFSVAVLASRRRRSN